MHAQTIQYPTTIGTFSTGFNPLTANSYFGPWGTPTVTNPLNSNALGNIRSLGVSDVINYPAQSVAQYIINSALANQGFPIGTPYGCGIEALSPLHPACGITGLVPVATPFGMTSVSPFNIPGVGQIPSVVNGATFLTTPSVFGQPHTGLNGLFQNPLQNLVANIALQSSLLNNPFQRNINPFAQVHPVSFGTGF